MADTRHVHGNCPACGRQSLFVAKDGYITCGRVDCPRPDAATGILSDAETCHVVVLDETAFTIRHPLIERLDDALMQCSLHEYLAGLDGPPAAPGRYRVTGQPGKLAWLPVAEEESRD